MKHNEILGGGSQVVRFDKESAERWRQIYMEPEKRNGTMQAALARSDRVFEILMTRSNALLATRQD